ncbi:hypothetical protein STTU_4523 [Streptomyces sp. Tu6071]|nr:hypothetical protein STTU_4523 [Streptomyces sp. Tu6071]
MPRGTRCCGTGRGPGPGETPGRRAARNRTRRALSGGGLAVMAE